MENISIRGRPEKFQRPRAFRAALPKPEILIGRLASAFLLLSSVALGEEATKPLPGLETSMRLGKQQYLVGEPIVLTFIARYKGSAANASLTEPDPYGQCGSYHLVVVPVAPKLERQSGPPCAPLFHEFNISCMFGGIGLAAGAEVQERILLNRLHDFTQPGAYAVSVTRPLSYFESWNKSHKANRPVGRASATFAFTIVAPRSPDDLKNSFSPFLTDLSSGSYKQKVEAASVISNLAAPFLEPYLLQMISTPQLRAQAIAGLLRLNTEEGRAAIFNFVSQDHASSEDQKLAIAALGEMGDASYGPRLLTLIEATDDKHRNHKLLVSAARLNPSAADVVIQQLLRSPSEADRENGVRALAATERPQALPVLVHMLGDSSYQVRSAAATGLVSLTRQTPSESGFFWTGSDPAADAPFWEDWLKANPQLPIHLLRDCPEASAHRLQ